MKKMNLLSCLLLLTGISFAQDDFDIYVSDAGGFPNPNYQILRFDANGENGEVFIDQQLGWPQDLVFLEEDNVVLVSNLNSGTINKHNATTGEYIGAFVSGIGGPTRMKIRNDTLYVLQWVGDGRVLRFSLDGEDLGPATATGVGRSIGLDWDADGKLYVSSYGRPPSGGNPEIPVEVRRYDTDGSDLGSFIGSDNLQGPTNIWFTSDGSGDLLVVDYNGGSVQRFDSDGAYQGVFISPMQIPEGVDFMPNGNILIGNGGTGAVKMYTAEGVFIEDLVTSGALGLNTPNAVIVRPRNAVAVTEVTEELVIVYPTVGRHFFLDQTFDSPIKLVEVFDATGRKLYSMQPQEQELWNATNEAKGIYFLRITISEGRLINQQVVVE